MKSKLRSFFGRTRDEGASALEYGLLMAGIALMVFTGAVFFGEAVCTLYVNADKALVEVAQSPTAPSAPGVGAPSGGGGGSGAPADPGNNSGGGSGDGGSGRSGSQ